MNPFAFYRAALLAATPLLLASCANHLTTRVDVYQPAERLAQLEALPKPSAKERQIRDQLRVFLHREDPEPYSHEWYEKLRVLIAQHRSLSDQIESEARRITRETIESFSNGQQEALSQTIAEAQAQDGAVCAAAEALQALKTQQQAALANPAATEDDRRLLKRRIEQAEQTLEAAKAAIAQPFQLAATQAANALWTPVNSRLDAFAASLRQPIDHALQTLDALRLTYLTSSDPQREAIYALQTQQAVEQLIRAFWNQVKISSHQLPANLPGLAGSTTALSPFSFSPDTFVLSFPPELATFYGQPVPTTLAKLPVEHFASRAAQMADQATKAVADRGGIRRNDLLTESVTNPLLSLAERDLAGWQATPAWTSMSSNVDSSVVIVREGPTSFWITTYDGNAAAVVDSSLRATANAAILALEGAKLASGLSLSAPVKPSGSPDTPTTPPAIPSSVYLAIARDRLRQADSLAGETASDAAGRKAWAARVRALIDSTPTLAAPANPPATSANSTPPADNSH